MDRRSASACNDFAMGFDTLSSGSIAATASSGYNGVNTDETDPDLTFLSNLFPVNYSSVAPSRDDTLQSLFWGLTQPTTLRLPNMIGRKSDYDPLRYLDASYFGQYPMQLTKSELFAPLNNYTYGHAAPAESITRKRQYLLNAAAPAYTPAKDIKEAVQAPLTVAKPAYRPVSPSETSPLAPLPPAGGDRVEMLQMELDFKALVNKTLSDKLKELAGPDNSAVASPGDTRIRMPSNYYQLFRDLTRTLNERTQELEETKARLEALLVGLVMSKESSVSTDGTFDPQELAHRITTKLQMLHSENQTLLRMVSHGNKQSLLVEMGLLKSELKLLRDRGDASDKTAV